MICSVCRSGYTHLFLQNVNLEIQQAWGVERSHDCLACQQPHIYVRWSSSLIPRQLSHIWLYQHNPQDSSNWVYEMHKVIATVPSFQLARRCGSTSDELVLYLYCMHAN